MTLFIKGLIFALLLFAAGAQVPWPATDGLGRQLPLQAETGPVKKDRFVGIFYFLWLGGHSTSGPHDLTKILADPNQELARPGIFHHWGEPELGYYYSRDPFVLRRHATQLSEAGVDFVALDITNAYVYDREVDALCETWLQMRKEGLPTPQITFLTNSSHERTVDQIFKRIYQPGLYRDLWFHWQGKPLLMANPEGLTPEQKDFFTLRRSWAWSKGHPWFGDGKDRWPWLDFAPQTPGWHTPGKPEFVPVAVAQHPVSNIGRSNKNRTQPPPGKVNSHEGIHFQEQWDHALEIDPEIIFVTGWNEWVAQRFVKKPGEGAAEMMGKKLETGESYFVDCYNLEFSRDIEPMKGGYGDAYYYQMIANIRRFKGTPALPEIQSDHAITIDGKFEDWDSVPTPFRDHLLDAPQRKEEGWNKQILTDFSGRNDFANLRVATDSEFVYFLIHTRAPITPPTGDHWLNILIDADLDPTTGWMGYDYLLNRKPSDDGTTSLEKLAQNGSATKAISVPFAYQNNMLEVRIPRVPEWLDRPLTFDFHASDNTPLDDSYFTLGDHAPDRRFNFRFKK